MAEVVRFIKNIRPRFKI